VWKVKHDTLI